MATEWFYTTNKQQMGPISWKELLELAEVGILKPHDLVWTEGMDDWVKAINQKGLFADGGAEVAVSAGKKSSYTQPKPPPGRRTQRVDDDDVEDEEDDKEAKRKARKREEARAKTSVGVKIGLILAAVVFVLFVLLLLGCGGSVLLWLSLRGGDGPRRETYTIFNLNQKAQNEKRFNFSQGQRVIITVTNQLSRPDTDVDLFVFRGNDGAAFAFDKQIPQLDRNCRVDFVVPANDSYRVVVVNLGPGVANRCDVAIDVR
jgi:GYF domain 2